MIRYNINYNEEFIGKIEEAQSILAALQVPQQQQSIVCCCALLALAGIKDGDSWSSATNEWMRIHDIIIFARDNLGKSYAENSREIFRKQAMHHFRNAAFIEDNGLATNSGNFRYRLTEEMLSLIKSFGSLNWNSNLVSFKKHHHTLIELYSSNRQLSKIPIQINSNNFTFSPGAHNQLQKFIIEEFASRFAPNSQCLYIGDSTNRSLVYDDKMFVELGITISIHNKLPDVVLYYQNRNILLLIEAVTSGGPMDPKRVRELEAMTSLVRAHKVYVTAFPNFKLFKQFADKLAWGTEVWIAEVPDHIIHYNGDKLLIQQA